MIYFDHHKAMLLPAGLEQKDSRLFRRDWAEFLRQWKIWKRDHPLKRIEDWLWEAEKNAWRKWWFWHTRGERQYMLDRRNEMQNRIFRPKYGLRRFQTGNFSMFPAGTTGAAAAVLALSASNNDAFNIDFSPPSPLDAGFGLFRDGTHDRVNSSGQNQINSSTDWITPRNSTIGDDYEVKWNLTVGLASRINDESYAEDTWTGLTISTGRGRYVGKSSSAASVSDTFEIDIGDSGTSTSDVNQDYTVEAGDLV